jgi:hypothetical protein
MTLPPRHRNVRTVFPPKKQCSTRAKAATTRMRALFLHLLRLLYSITPAHGIFLSIPLLHLLYLILPFLLPLLSITMLQTPNQFHRRSLLNLISIDIHSIGARRLHLLSSRLEVPRLRLRGSGGRVRMVLARFRRGRRRRRGFLGSQMGLRVVRMALRLLAIAGGVWWRSLIRRGGG